jgi:hypothetical protein
MGQQPSGPSFSAADRAEAPGAQAPLTADAEKRDARLQPRAASSRYAPPRFGVGRLLIAAFVLGWCGGFGSHWALEDAGRPHETTDALDIRTVVEQIIKVESDGNPDAKNKRSSATGLAQFLDETWLRLIRTHRPDLVVAHSESEILELRRDADLALEIAARFTEGNAEMLRKRGLPITPGTLYLAHFAGSAGAVALLSALEQADAASTMASADASGRTSREKLVRANPFLEGLTVADLKTWADRKMRGRSL